MPFKLCLVLGLVPKEELEMGMLYCICYSFTGTGPFFLFLENQPSTAHESCPMDL